MGSVTDMASTDQFQTGLVIGGVAALFVAGWTLLLPVRLARWPIAGLAHVGAVLVALEFAGSRRLVLRPDGWGLVTVALAVAGGLLAQRRTDPLLTGLVLVPAGAAALQDLRTIEPDWISVAVAAVVVVGGALAADFDVVQRRRSLGPLLLAGTALGIYATVPDTEAARVLVGVALPISIAAACCSRVALGTGGAAGSVAVWALVIARDGAARPGAVVGGLAALGLYLMEPLGRRVADVLVGPAPRSIALLEARIAAIVYTLVLDGAVVLWMTRVAGLRESAVAAFALTLLGAVGGATLSVALVPTTALRRLPTARPPRARARPR